MSEAFSAYTTDGIAADASPAQQQQPQLATSSQTAALSPAAKDALLVIFSKKGSYVQELLVEELVAAVDALSREALSETLRLVLRSTPAVLAMSSLEALGPFRRLLVPFLTPVELLTRFAPAVELTAEDQEALGVVRGVFRLVQQAQLTAAGTSGVSMSASESSSSSSNTGSSSAASGMVFSSTSEGRTAAPEFGSQGFNGPSAAQSAAAAAIEAFTGAASVAGELRPLLPELLPGIQHTGELFVRTFADRVATRLAESFAAGGVVGSAGMTEAADTEMAMAALGFMPGSGPGPDRTRSLSATSSIGLLSNVDPFGMQKTFKQQQQHPIKKGSHSVLSVSSFIGDDSSSITNHSIPLTAGFTSHSGAESDVIISSSSNASFKGLVSPGQVVVGLFAAPLMIGLAPLALLSEMQRKQQRRQ